VQGARIAIRRDDAGALWTYEASIPLSELKDLQPADGKVVRFAFRCVNDGRNFIEWAHGRSVCKKNAFAFHPGWKTGYSVETEWGFVRR
jgi:hypothetical protein